MSEHKLLGRINPAECGKIVKENFAAFREAGEPFYIQMLLGRIELPHMAPSLATLGMKS